MTLTITSRGTKLRKYGGCLEVEKPDGKDRVSARVLYAVHIAAPCGMTPDANRGRAGCRSFV